MKTFRNLNTQTKILGLVILMAIFLAGVSFTGYYYNKDANKEMNYLFENKQLAVSAIKEVDSENNLMQAIVYKFLLDPVTQKEQQQLQDQYNSLVKEYQEDIDNFTKTQLDSYETERIQKYIKERDLYEVEVQNVFQIANSGDKLGAYNLLTSKALTHMETANTLLEEMSDYGDKTAKELVDETNHHFVTSSRIVLSVSIVVILLALFLGYMIGRTISVPLKKVVSAVNEIAEGNLTVDEIEIDSKDEIGVLAQAVNKMSTHLRVLIGQVVETGEQVASSSEELSAGAEQSAQASNQIAGAISEVATGTEHQAHAIDETSAAIEQMSASIQQLAAAVSTVSEHTEVTSSSTEEGRKAVDNAVKQMDAVAHSSAQVEEAVNKLSASSQQIGEITDVISGIAGQTNLLALNAAIEAARAGEQGRGFAVVAEEVRKLAEQSAEAATKIASLINENQANIDDAVQAMEAGANDVQLGIQVVNQAGEAFSEIAHSVSELSAQAQEISATTQELAGGSQQIVSSAQEIENISKQNLDYTQTVSAAVKEQNASVEQVASASQMLTKLAEELQLAVSKFRI